MVHVVAIRSEIRVVYRQQLKTCDHDQNFFLGQL